MNAIVTIEGRRCSPVTPFDSKQKDAAFARHCERGSQRLRDAILLAKGIEPPAPPPPVRKKAHLPTACPLCSAPTKPNRMFIAHIQAAVASYYELPLASMSSKQQYWKVAHPRQLAMFLAAELTDHSLAEIGRRFNRDHTTVMHALKAVQKRIQDDPEVGLDAEVLRERLAA